MNPETPLLACGLRQESDDANLCFPRTNPCPPWPYPRTGTLGLEPLPSHPPSHPRAAPSWPGPEPPLPRALLSVSRTWCAVRSGPSSAPQANPALDPSPREVLLSLGMFARGRDARPGEEGPNLLRGGGGHPGVRGLYESSMGTELEGRGSQSRNPIWPPPSEAQAPCGPLPALPLIPFAADTGVAGLPLASTLGSPEKPLGAS